MIKLASTVLIFNRQGQILAVSRKEDKNDFGLPGGKINFGETVIQSAIRELKEETGLEIKESDLKEVFNRIDEDYAVICYLAKIDSAKGEISTTEKGVVRWVEPKEIILGCFGKYNHNLLNYLNYQGKPLSWNEEGIYEAV